MTALDLLRAVAAGFLALGFIAFAVIAIVWNEMRLRAKARRNLEARAYPLRASSMPSGGVVA